MLAVDFQVKMDETEKHKENVKEFLKNVCNIDLRKA